MGIDGLVLVLDLFGALLLAFSGALLAGKKQRDILGIFLLSFVAAISGRTVRDVLLGITPVLVLRDMWYVWYIMITIIPVGLVYLFRAQVFHFGKLIKLTDALGLGLLFSSSMTDALLHHVGFIPAMFLGILAASVGGVLRDLLGGELPLLLRRELYAFVCLLGGVLYFILYLFPIEREYIVIFSAVFVSIFRVLVIQKNLSLSR